MNFFIPRWTPKSRQAPRADSKTGSGLTTLIGAPLENILGADSHLQTTLPPADGKTPLTILTYL